MTRIEDLIHDWNQAAGTFRPARPLQFDDESLLQLPTGTFCTFPFRCPHLDACASKEPSHPLRLLPPREHVDGVRVLAQELAQGVVEPWPLRPVHRPQALQQDRIQPSQGVVRRRRG